MKRIVLAGGSGFLGRALAAYFLKRQYEVVILTRAPADNTDDPREVEWDARTVGQWAAELEGAEAVINLTGRSVNCRYTAANRREIMESRVDSTHAIGVAISTCKEPPRFWLNASTATIYKDPRGPAWGEDGQIGATAEAKDEFSVEVAVAWEQGFFSETVPSCKIALRTAMVLGCGENSVFPVLRRLVRFGLGGTQSSGDQFISWIHQQDFCRAVEWLLQHENAAGIYNVCAPTPLTNSEMMETLRRAFGMPFSLPASRWMLELGAIFLRTETELILTSRRVYPQRLLNAGFTFDYATFESAVRDLKRRCN